MVDIPKNKRPRPQAISPMFLIFVFLKNIMEVEYFIHGALCVGYSGHCMMSNNFSLRDANVGGCAQSCRWAYNVYVEEYLRGKIDEFVAKVVYQLDCAQAALEKAYNDYKVYVYETIQREVASATQAVTTNLFAFIDYTEAQIHEFVNRIIDQDQAYVQASFQYAAGVVYNYLVDLQNSIKAQLNQLYVDYDEKYTKNEEVIIDVEKYDIQVDNNFQWKIEQLTPLYEQAIKEKGGNLLKYDKFVPLRNDYMFKAVMQKSPNVLKNLIAVMLEMPVGAITKCQLMNPIVIGEAINEKTIILDVRVEINETEIIDIEMQNYYDKFLIIHSS